MAFFVWQPKGVVTAPCDTDIQRLCLSQVQDMAAMPGAVQLCLSDIVSHGATAAQPSRAASILHSFPYLTTWAGVQHSLHAVGMLWEVGFGAHL
jgi:hypothetical protein